MVLNAWRDDFGGIQFKSDHKPKREVIMLIRKITGGNRIYD
jgi:hypothetical protein